MRFALGSFAVVCSFAFAASLFGQDLTDPVTTPGEFLERLQGAPTFPHVDVAPAGDDLAPGEDVDVAPAEAPSLTEEAEAGFSKALEFETTIIHLASSEPFSEEERGVTADSVDALLENWKATGKVDRISSVRLTSVDNQEAFVTIGEQVPMTTSRASLGGGRGGPMQSSVTYQDVGTVFGVRGQVDGDRIVIECNVEESRLEPASPASAPAPSVDAVEGSSPPQKDPDLHSLQTVNCETVLSVVDGEKVVVSGAFQQTPKGSKATIVTLKATIRQ